MTGRQAPIGQRQSRRSQKAHSVGSNPTPGHRYSQVPAVYRKCQWCLRPWSYAPADYRGHSTPPVPPGRARPRGGRDHCRPDRDHSEMAYRRPSRRSQGTQGGLSALYGKAARRARVLISPRPVPRRWMYYPRAPKDVYALSIACCDDWPGLLAVAKERDGGGYARVQGVRCPQNRHDRSQELLQALAVPVSAAWAWAEAHQKDRARRLAAGDRGAIPGRFRKGALPFGRVPGCQPGAQKLGRRRPLVRVPAVPVHQQLHRHPVALRRDLRPARRGVAVLQAEHHLGGTQGGRGPAG